MRRRPPPRVCFSVCGLQPCQKVKAPCSMISMPHSRAVHRTSAASILAGPRGKCEERLEPSFRFYERSDCIDGLRRQKERTRRFRTRHPCLYHGDRWNLAPGLHDDRRVANGGALVRRRISQRIRPQGVLLAAVVDGPRISPLSFGASRRRPNRRLVFKARQDCQ